jgi:hypothetical protein
MGLVDWVVGDDAFEPKIAELTERLLSMPWTSTRLTKKLANAAFDVPLDSFLLTYFEYQQLATSSPEHLAAMAEHRAARAAR